MNVRWYQLNYFDSLKATMKWLGEKPNTIFIGQTVGCPGTFMYPTLADVSMEKRLEFPVNESFQMQFSLGVALTYTGMCVISVYPRQNFLLLATGDMVNMVDKIKPISEGVLNPHLIIRVATGPDTPVHPGHQHVNDYGFGLQSMFKNIVVLRVTKPEDAMIMYGFAYENPGQYLIIEEGNSYGQK